MLHVKPRDCRERDVSVVLCLSRVFYLVLALITMPPKNKRQKQSESALAIGREKLVRLMSGSSDHNVSNQQDAYDATKEQEAVTVRECFGYRKREARPPHERVERP